MPGDRGIRVRREIDYDVLLLELSAVRLEIRRVYSARPSRPSFDVDPNDVVRRAKLA
jgi:hypothetical protein